MLSFEIFIFCSDCLVWRSGRKGDLNWCDMAFLGSLAPLVALISLDWS